MRVVLAGYNVDAEVIQEAIGRGVSPDRLTPEILSAAYARISRNPAPVDELRQQSRKEVARARASNEQIIFGLGHASVAEHATFNFDLLGLSRLAIEAVEHFRLCSYTEKSQRYIRLQDEVVTPQELVELGFEQRFRSLVDLQYQAYHRLYQGLRDDFFARHPEQAETQRKTLEGWAKEDARYVTCLAVEGQLGLTVNARNLELIIRRLSGHPLHEVRQLAGILGRLARGIAPSLIRYTEPGDSERRNERASEEAHAEDDDPSFSTKSVRLLDGPAEGDRTVAAALLHEATLAPWDACYRRAARPDVQQRVIDDALFRLGLHDAPPRAFELVSLRFELIVSASCFAQLKRHRMATLLTQPYDPSLGVTLPESISRLGMEAEFRGVMEQSAQLYDEIRPRHAEAASYVLTQAHRRRVVLLMNARELYHFCRLRQDHHAQWDIRRLADRMLELARQRLPLTLKLACGKDHFLERRAEVFPDTASLDRPVPCE